MPKDLVILAMEAHFKGMHSDLKSLQYPLLTYEYFGKIKASPKKLRYFLSQRLIPNYRKEPTPERLEFISTIYKLYKQAQAHAVSRKFKKHRDGWATKFKHVTRQQIPETDSQGDDGTRSSEAATV